MVLCFIFRTAVPVLKYPFILLFGVSIIYFISKIKKDILSYFSLFSKNFIIVILSILFLIFAFFFSSKYYLIIFKDIINILIIFYFFIVFNIAIKNSADLKLFNSQFLKHIFYFAFLISLFEIAKTYFLLTDGSLDSLMFDLLGITESETNRIDYNFALLPVFFSILIILNNWLKKEKMTNSVNLLYTLILILYSFTIILSGSKRGFVSLLALIAILFLTQLIAILKNKNITGFIV